MRKIIVFLLMSTSMFFLISCEPEQQIERTNFHIVNVTTHRSSLNDCAASDGGINGTIIDFYLEMDSVVGYGVMPKLRFTATFESGAVLGPKVSTFPDFSYDFTDNEIEHTQCIRFLGSNWVDIKFEVFDPEGRISEPYTIRVDKPAGAN